MGLFQDLSANKLIERWVPLLDWLLSNNRFSQENGWDSQKKSNFTTRIKNLSGIGKENWHVQAAKNAVWEFEKADCAQIVMNSDSSEGESLVRHIRNGIAHGAVQIEQLNGNFYLDIADYKSGNHKVQTAHIWLPVERLFDIYGLYNEIEATTSQQTSQKEE